MQFSSLFSTDPARFSTAAVEPHRIETGDSRPVSVPSRRESPTQREEISEQVDKMLKMGVIQPSPSPWASGVVLGPCRNGFSPRFCVDYRNLNRVTVKDAYPLPRINDIIDALQGAKYFSSIDLRKAFWQIPVAESSKHKTVFTCKRGLFEYNSLPFGLTNSPATFQRAMDVGVKWSSCVFGRCYCVSLLVFV